MNIPITLRNRGFTFVELIIVFAVILIITAIATSAFINARKTKLLHTITDNVVLTFEKAKADAISGKDGSAYGVRVSTTTYTYFKGTSYSAGDSANKTYTHDSNYYVSANFPNADRSVVFARMTGIPNVTGTTTISRIDDPSTYIRIYVGSQGEITVLK